MEEESRKLPTVNLCGAEFYVDATKGLLIDTLNSDNHFHIYEMMMLDDHFEFLFDKKTRNLKETDWFDRSREGYEYLWLRPLGVYDPEGGWKCLSKDDLLFLDGLPVIDIEGVTFRWAEQTGLLHQVDNPWNMIAKSEIEIRDGKEGFYFDKEKKMVPFPHELPAELKMLPPHISFIPVSEINHKILAAEAQKNTKATSPKKGRKLR